MRFTRLAFIIASSATLAHALSTTTPPEYCWTEFKDALPGIYEDVSRYATQGITEANLNAARELMSTPQNTLWHDGAIFHIKDNVLYGEKIHDHTHLPVAMYGATLNRLLKNYTLPDAVLFISVADHNDQILRDDGELFIPGFRSCRVVDSANIVLPTYAMWQSGVWRENFAAQNNVSFHDKENVVFSAFSDVAEASDGIFTKRYSERGEQDQNVRAALTRFANQSDPSSWRVKPMINVERPDIRTWGKYKYIVHVEGVTCSNKLEKVATLGSVLIVEESGYASSLHRMLRPWVHYVPFYRHLPQELRDVVNFLDQTPGLAERIALQLGQFVKHMQSMRGLECQLMMTITEYAKMQRFQPKSLPAVDKLPFQEWALWCFKREFRGDPVAFDKWERELLTE